jgi:DNA-binding CsgD family transcriptional regulator
VLVGRDAELALISRLVADARLGRSRALQIVGGPGLGKTALLAAAVAQAGGFDVLQVTGTDAESRVPYATLHALLRPVLNLLDAIPAMQARSLRGALALEDVEPDRLAAYAGTLSLLAEAAGHRPLLVVLDDAHLVDRASLEAIVFAARRLAGEAIGLLLASRAGESIVDDAGVRRLDLAPLQPAAAMELLRMSGGRALQPAVARRLVVATGGNALALVELPGLLTEAQREGQEPLKDPLPVTQTVEDSVRRRLRQVPLATRDALLLAAAGAPAALLTEAPLEAAEDVGLIVVREGVHRFPHPLFGAAIYRQATAERQRDAHQRIADGLTDPDDADRRAWHLAASRDSPDEAAAAALEAAAARARARGGYVAQSQALLRAAELTVETGQQARRLLEAATAAYWSGESAFAVSLAERALPLANDPLLRARVLHRLAIIADWHGNWRDRVVSTEDLEREAKTVASLDPRLSVGLLGVILQRHFQALDTRPAMALAERRLHLCEPIGDERHLRAIQDLARAAGLRGEVARTAALCNQVLERAHGDGVGGVLEFATNIAEPLLWLERYGECGTLLERSVDEARQQGNLVRLMFELTNLALLELRMGSFTRAFANGSEAAELASETGNDYLLACNLAVLAHLSAASGEADAHETQAGQAAEIAGRLSDELIAGEVRLARAEWALANGRSADAIAVLEPLQTLLAAKEVGEPGVIPFEPDLIEALVRDRRMTDALAQLDRFEARARALDRRWALAAAARCRGLLAEPDRVDACFARALELHEAAGWSPFQRARTLLLFGERLRRSRRRTEARVPLREAIDILDGLGAAVWSDRARAELTATGESIGRRDPTATEKLTAQELQIALQVAQGRSNREAAVALFLSPKTVEYHLTHVYRKLDLNSRAELVRLFARQDPGDVSLPGVAGMRQPVA